MESDISLATSGDKPDVKSQTTRSGGLRLHTGLTQEQFAASLGATYGTINRWENGKAKPSPIAMKLIRQQLEEMGEQGKGLLEKYFSS